MATVEINLSENDSVKTISVNAFSKGMFTAFYKINNQYLSICEKDFQTIRYEKNILQGDFEEKKLISFNTKNSYIKTQNLLNETKNFITYFENFDKIFNIFSALFYIRFNSKKDTNTIFCFANQEIWSVKYSYFGEEELSFSDKKYPTKKYIVEFENVSKNSSSRTDILTNNLFSEENQIILWFSDDEQHLPIKAKYVMSPFSIYWHLDEYWHKD